jgi:hypothetical protein
MTPAPSEIAEEAINTAIFPDRRASGMKQEELLPLFLMPKSSKQTKPNF